MIIESAEQLTSEEYILLISPLGRVGNTEDMAGYILWPVSKQPHGCRGISL